VKSPKSSASINMERERLTLHLLYARNHIT
jgi:hypothetical protein